MVLKWMFTLPKGSGGSTLTIPIITGPVGGGGGGRYMQYSGKHPASPVLGNYYEVNSTFSDVIGSDAKWTTTCRMVAYHLLLLANWGQNSHKTNSLPATEHWNCTVSSFPCKLKHSPSIVTDMLLLAFCTAERWIVGVQISPCSIMNLKRSEPISSFRLPITIN